MGAGFKAEFSVGAGPQVVGKARDVELTADGGVVDVTARDSAGWKEFVAGLREWGLSCQTVWVPDDVAFELIQTAYINGTLIAVKLLDIVGAQGHGWSGNAIVTKIGRSEPLDGALVCPIEFKGTGALTPVDPA